MTELNKPVTRKSNSTVRDRGKIRNLVITLFPNGTVGLRPSGTRKLEIVTLDSCYSLAVKQRVAREKAEKLIEEVGMGIDVLTVGKSGNTPDTLSAQMAVLVQVLADTQATRGNIAVVAAELGGL